LWVRNLSYNYILCVSILSLSLTHTHINTSISSTWSSNIKAKNICDGFFWRSCLRDSRLSVQPLDTPHPLSVINPFTYINNIAITMKMFVLLPRSNSTSYIPNYLNMLLMILIITVNILIQTRKMPIMLLGLKFNAFEFQKKLNLSYDSLIMTLSQLSLYCTIIGWLIQTCTIILFRSPTINYFGHIRRSPKYTSPSGHTCP
jgi:hypothetical protein